jgi:hypothetical protein
MKRLLIASLVGATALLAPSAQATPPDLVWIEDQPFAAATDTVFVLRTTIDNLGVYTSAHSETFLVAIDVATGEETYWLVYRARRDIVDDPAKERVEVTLFDRKDWHDPYAIVADAGAALAPAAMPGEAEEIATSADGETYTIAADYPWPTFAFSRAASLAQMERSLVALAERVADAERIAPVSTRDLYPVSLAYHDCSFATLGRPIGVNASGYQLIRIDCDAGEDVGSASLIQAILPDEPVRPPYSRDGRDDD